MGSHTRVKVVKNKVAPPFKEAEFDVMYGKGISKEGELLDIGVRFDIVKKSGAWFGYKELRLGQGRDNAKEYLVAHPELAQEIEVQIREKLKESKQEPKGDDKAAKAAAPVEKAPAPKVSKADIDILVDDD